MDKGLAQMAVERALGRTPSDRQRCLPLEDPGPFPRLEHGVDCPSVHRRGIIVECDLGRPSAPVPSESDLGVL